MAERLNSSFLACSLAGFTQTRIKAVKGLCLLARLTAPVATEGEVKMDTGEESDREENIEAGVDGICTPILTLKEAENCAGAIYFKVDAV